jgi:glycerate kinase
VTGPDGNVVEAEWAALEDGTGVVEMARASGLALVRRNEPLTATTYGTGELIAAALDHGCRRIIVGVGGSATVDGGLGALDALSWSLRGAEVLVACDVMTLFLDAPALFGPQKGASAPEIELLEQRLAALAVRLLATQEVDVRVLPGSGAAGGLGGGLAAIGARLVPGFDVVADTVGFPAALAASSAVITGEGRVDPSTLSGKVVARVLGAAHAGFRPAGVVTGAIAPGIDLGVPTQALADMGSNDPFGAAAALAEEAACLLAGRLRAAP